VNKIINGAIVKKIILILILIFLSTDEIKTSQQNRCDPTLFRKVRELVKNESSSASMTDHDLKKNFSSYTTTSSTSEKPSPISMLAQITKDALTKAEKNNKEKIDNNSAKNILELINNIYDILPNYDFLKEIHVQFGQDKKNFNTLSKYTDKIVQKLKPKEYKVENRNISITLEETPADNFKNILTKLEEWKAYINTWGSSTSLENPRTLEILGLFSKPKLYESYVNYIVNYSNYHKISTEDLLSTMIDNLDDDNDNIKNPIKKITENFKTENKKLIKDLVRTLLRLQEGSTGILWELDTASKLFDNKFKIVGLNSRGEFGYMKEIDVIASKDQINYYFECKNIQNEKSWQKNDTISQFLDQKKSVTENDSKGKYFVLSKHQIPKNITAILKKENIDYIDPTNTHKNFFDFLFTSSSSSSSSSSSC